MGSSSPTFKKEKPQFARSIDLAWAATSPIQIRGSAMADRNHRLANLSKATSPSSSSRLATILKRWSASNACRSWSAFWWVSEQNRCHFHPIALGITTSPKSSGHLWDSLRPSPKTSNQTTNPKWEILENRFRILDTKIPPKKVCFFLRVISGTPNHGTPLRKASHTIPIFIVILMGMVWEKYGKLTIRGSLKSHWFLEVWRDGGVAGWGDLETNHLLLMVQKSGYPPDLY